MGLIIGSMLAAYVVCKVLEKALLGWFITGFALKSFISAGLTMALLFAAAINKASLLGSYTGSDEEMLGAQIVACVGLPFIRVTWHAFRRHRAQPDATEF